MRAVVQRVLEASVQVLPGAAYAGVVEGRVESIGAGLCVLLGFEAGDTAAQRDWMAGKLAQLRIFEDDEGRMNRSVLETGGAMLIVPNFTLAGDCRKGRRPSFDRAMPPDEAAPAFGLFLDAVRALGVPVAAGAFQASMRVSIVNDGPVTLVVETPRA